MPTLNPRSLPNPRFDPLADLDNALAHENAEFFAAAADAATGGDSSAATDVQAVVRAALDRAVSHYEENLEPDQVKATDYYHGRPFGDEQEGRSKVVSTDVRDATLAQMPSLLRVFFGPERAAEFNAERVEDEPVARQMTDYIEYVISNDNPGYVVFQSAFKDALVRRVGAFKWWWDTATRVQATDYTGLIEEQVYTLIEDEGTEDWSVTAIHAGAVDPTGLQSPETFDIRILRRQQEGRARFEAIPSEELVFTPGARSIDSAPLVAHVRMVPVEDLVRLGVDSATIARNRGQRRRSDSDDLADARQYHGALADDDGEDALDASQQKVLFSEAYMLLDGDGDGISELRLFQCVGPDYEITNGDGLGEIVDERPFAVFTSEPEPHTIVGLSNWDLLRDVQRVKSQVSRGMLDSLAQALEPKTEVVDGEVNVADLVSPEINGIVRVRKPGMMREILHTFMGPQTLEVMRHYDEVKENRTGHSRASAGLDADSLQSSTKAAVAAVLTGSQQRLEMIARTFAETGVKPLMKGLMRLVVKHQSRTRMLRLRNEYIAVDPRHWDTAMDVKVNVGLGQGAPEDRINSLAAMVGRQMELKAAGCPFVTWVEIRAGLVKLAELTGVSNADAFFRPWGAEEEAQMQQAAAGQQPPLDPGTMLAMVEAQKAAEQARLAQMKAESEREIEIAKLSLETWKAHAADDRERDRIAREAALKELELEMKYHSLIPEPEVRAKVEVDRAAQSGAVGTERLQGAPPVPPAGEFAEVTE